MFRLRDLVGLAIILAILVVPEASLPLWVRIALAVLAVVIVTEVAWELFRHGRHAKDAARPRRPDRRH